MELTFRDYSAEQVEAARSVLLELVHLLGEYRDDIVVVGGRQVGAADPVRRMVHGVAGIGHFGTPRASDVRIQEDLLHFEEIGVAA
jgi:hypothetical protein